MLSAIISYECYPNTEFDHADALLRKCLDDISVSELEKGLLELDRMLEKNQSDTHFHYAVTIYLASAILMFRNNQKCLERLPEFYERRLDERFQPFLTLNMFSYNNSRLALLFMITLFCLRGTDNELCKRLIDRWISVQRKDNNVFEPRERLTVVDFLCDPLYSLMISGNIELAGYYLDKLIKEREADGGEMLKGVRFNGYLESALHYRQTDFLRLFYDREYDISENMPVLLYIFSCRENMENASQIWDVRREILPAAELEENGCVGETGRRCIYIPQQKELAFLLNLCRNYGEKSCQELFKTIPLIDAIYESDLCWMLANDEFLTTFEEGHIPHCRFDEEKGRYAVCIGWLLNKYTARDVRIIAEQGSVSDAMIYLYPEKNITFDMRKCLAPLLFGSWGKNTITNMKLMLKKYQVLFDSEEFTQFLASLLDVNDAVLTRLMIQHGAFSEQNIGEAVEYVVENKLYKALSEINKRYYKED